MTPRLGPIGAASPPPVGQQELWDHWGAERYRAVPAAARIWRAAGVTRRHAAVDPRAEDASCWSTGRRMQRYLAEALPLGEAAVSRALAGAGVAAEDVGLFVVASCTGYATPGLDLLIAGRLGMSTSVERLAIGHMGCYAALPGLAAAADTAAQRRRPAVLLCVELPTLHVQPPSRDPAQVIVHALFGDAAAAAVVGAPGGEQGGLTVVDRIARTDAAHQQAMSWTITDNGFVMGLGPEVPAVLARHVGPVVGELLARNGVDRSAVAGWAIHPGGPRILEVCGDALGLDEAALEPSRATLAEHGNCSSATVLLVLDRVRRAGGLAPGQHVVMLAFGPGLTLFGALLRMEGPAPPGGAAGPASRW